MRMVLVTLMLNGTNVTRQVSHDTLMDAIAEVESNRGATSSNVYQLRPIYVADIRRVTGQRITFRQAVETDEMARWCMSAYWDHYGHLYYRKTQRSADAEVLARIHNGGPDGWKRRSTAAYWTKVRRVLEREVKKLK